MPKRARKTRKLVESVVPKEPLAKEVARILDERGLTQTEASYLIQDAPSQISLMVNGRLRGFSHERLLRTLTRLGRDVDIVLRAAKRGGGKVRVITK